MSRRRFGFLSKTLLLAVALTVRVAPPRADAQAQTQPPMPPAAPVTTIGANGLEVRSGDSAYRLRVRGYLHADTRLYPGDDDNRGVDSFLLRRARPIVEVTAFRIFDFRLMTDFGGGTAVVQDAYFDARFGNSFNVRAGKQKPPVGQERLSSAVDILFIERALPTALVPNRDVGVIGYGDLAPWLAYQFGVFNGVIDGGSGDTDTTDSKDLAGRLAFSPFKASKDPQLQAFTIGIAGSSGKELGTPAAPALPQYRSGGQLAFFRYRSDGTAPNTTIADGQRTRFTTHGQYYVGQLGVQAEYVIARQAVRRATSTATLANRSWQVTGSWVLSGEPATGRIVAPRTPFDWSKKTWGAFEVVARVNALTIDDDAFPVFANPDQAASEATATGLGLNWFLNRNVKIAANYELTRFERGAAAGADRGDEHALFTRFQIGF